MTPITKEQLFEMLDTDLHETVEQMLAPETVLGITVYECLDLGSPEAGMRSFMIYGPTCTYKTVEQTYAGHLDGRHPVCHYAKEV